MSITINCTVLGHSQPFWKEWEWGLPAFLKLVTEEKLIIWMENSLKYKLRLSCSFMYLQLANLLLLNMCFEYHRAASESGHSNWGTWKKIIQSQRFLKTRFSIFFANGLITFKNILRVVAWEVRYVQMVC